MRNQAIAKFDELNTLRTKLIVLLKSNDEDKKKKKVLDGLIYDYLIFCYTSGVDGASEDLMLEAKYDPKFFNELINVKIDGKTYEDRIDEYYESKDLEAILKVADTDGSRIFNGGAIETARRGKAKTKTWHTMLDDRVRDQHSYLEGMELGIDDYFYTYDGDKAQCPEDFVLPQNNVNCRCYLTFGY